uniref:Uncharacterized protein n=1 Tax=Anguilla anguilla TaxID=7936 RepID=A0A0E9SBV7_ANGAN
MFRLLGVATLLVGQSACAT